MPRQARSRIVETTRRLLMNGMVIFLGATAIAIVAIILQRRRGRHER
jgi:hypothetical protein